MQAVWVLRQACLFPKAIAHPFVTGAIGQGTKDLEGFGDVQMGIRAAAPEMKAHIFNIQAALALRMENEPMGPAPLVAAVQSVEFRMQFFPSHSLSFAQDVPPAGDCKPCVHAFTPRIIGGTVPLSRRAAP